MVYDKANELAALIRESGEFKRYTAAKERIEAGSMADTLLKEYKKLQLRAQAAMVSGETDEECIQKLGKLGELLQMDGEASEFLMAEYSLSRLVGDVYRIIAEACELDLSMLD